jgi:hypothetical protein
VKQTIAEHVREPDPLCNVSGAHLQGPKRHVALVYVYGGVADCSEFSALGSVQKLP